MTGPALLLGVGFSAISAFLRADPGYELLSVFVGIFAWLLSVLAIFWAGRLLTRKGYFTRTMRGMGFAQSVHILDLLTLIPALGPIAVFLTSTVFFLATWMAAAEAHETHGWRSLILPLLGIVVIIMIPIAVIGLAGGMIIGLEAIFERIGLVQP